ncbi:rhodanese-like domain-containing protein [Paracoccus sp. p4-l81]|uniref:rhodanese-like domain-containing protein n=1 Tax=unclassified Paracoccus (in: a-proteobacteria) TaxID=2688777 RepID=UPI0035B6F04B
MFGFLRPSGPQPRSIAPAKAVARAARGDLVVIDIRDASELRASGTARGAIHVPMASLRMKLDPASPELLPGITPTTPIALYCASGGRSQSAAQALIAMGYTEVYNLGGLHDWQAGGGVVDRA